MSLDTVRRWFVDDLNIVWVPGTDILRNEDGNSILYLFNHLPQCVAVFFIKHLHLFLFVTDRTISAMGTRFSNSHPHNVGRFDGVTVIPYRDNKLPFPVIVYLWKGCNLFSCKLRGKLAEDHLVITLPEPISFVQETFYHCQKYDDDLVRRIGPLSTDPELEIVTVKDDCLKLYRLPTADQPLVIPAVLYETNMSLVSDNGPVFRKAFVFHLTDQVRLCVRAETNHTYTQIIWLKKERFKPICYPYLDHKEEIRSLLLVETIRDLPPELIDLILTALLPSPFKGRLVSIQD